MIEKRNLTEFVINGFVLACILIISVSLGIIGKTYFDQSWFTSAAISIVGFAALFSLRQQSLLARKLEQTAVKNRDIAAYEAEIERRFDLLSQEIKFSGTMGGLSRTERKNLNQNMKLVENLITGLQHRVAELESALPATEEEYRFNPGSSPNPAETPQDAGFRDSAEQSAPSGEENNSPGKKPVESNLPNPAISSEPPASNIATLYPRQSAEHTAEPETTTVAAPAESPGAPLSAPALQRELRARHSAGTASNSPAASSLDDSFELHLQPIVELTTRKPEFYEALLRKKNADGTFLQTGQMMSEAEQNGQIHKLDQKAIFGSVRMLRTLSDMNRTMKLFCNISARSLGEEADFEKIHAFLEANIALSGALSFEIPQSRYKRLSDREKGNLSRIAQLGFGLSLDQTFDLKFDAPALRTVGFCHIKVPASVLLNPNLSEDLDITPSELSFELGRSDLHLMASEIERESQVMNLIDFEVRYGQGDFFAPPRPVKPELLNPPQQGNQTAVQHATG